MSRTISPSARNSTRSAIAAACASWVTITVVWPSVSTDVAQQREDLAAGRGVEVAGRLVGEHHARPRDERAGDGHALLLAAGQLGRAVPSRSPRPTLLDQLVEPLGSGLLPGELERQHDVLLRREHREQVEELEDEADVVAPQLRELGVVEAGDVDAGDRDLTLVGRSRPARMCISVDLPEPDGPMTAVSRPRGDVDGHAAQRVDGGVALAVAADDVAWRTTTASAGLEQIVRVVASRS